MDMIHVEPYELLAENMGQVIGVNSNEELKHQSCSLYHAFPPNSFQEKSRPSNWLPTHTITYDNKILCMYLYIYMFIQYTIHNMLISSQTDMAHGIPYKHVYLISSPSAPDPSPCRPGRDSAPRSAPSASTWVPRHPLHSVPHGGSTLGSGAFGMGYLMHLPKGLQLDICEVEQEGSLRLAKSMRSWLGAMPGLVATSSCGIKHINAGVSLQLCQGVQMIGYACTNQHSQRATRDIILPLMKARNPHGAGSLSQLGIDIKHLLNHLNHHQIGSRRSCCCFNLVHLSEKEKCSINELSMKFHEDSTFAGCQSSNAPKRNPNRMSSELALVFLDVLVGSHVFVGNLKLQLR